MKEPKEVTGRLSCQHADFDSIEKVIVKMETHSLTHTNHAHLAFHGQLVVSAHTRVADPLVAAATP